MENTTKIKIWKCEKILNLFKAYVTDSLVVVATSLSLTLALAKIIECEYVRANINGLWIYECDNK